MASNSIAVYLIILVLIVAIVFFVLPRNTTVSTTTVAGTTVKVTTVPQTSIGTTTVGANLSSCLSSEQQTAQIFNGNFSTGTYAGWNVIGNGFGSAPANIVKYNENLDYFGSQWSGYNGSYFASNFGGGTQVVGGNLTSNTFLVTEPYLNFKLVSQQAQNLYIAILLNGTPAITTHFDTYAVPGNSANATSTFVNASVNLIPLLCDKVQIRVVAGTSVSSTGAANLNYMAVTGFYMSKKAVSSPDVVVNQSVNLTS